MTITFTWKPFRDYQRCDDNIDMETTNTGRPITRSCTKNLTLVSIVDKNPITHQSRTNNLTLVSIDDGGYAIRRSHASKLTLVSAGDNGCALKKSVIIYQTLVSIGNGDYAKNGLVQTT